MFSTGEIIIQQTVNGLILGCFYALISLGYTMVYGIVRLLNFAHGDVYMVGAFVGFFIFGALAAVTGTGWLSIILAMIAAMFLCGVLGFLILRFAYRPLLDAPRMSLLITAIGVSLVLQNAMMILTNGEFKFFNHSVNPRTGIALGNITITWIQLVLLGITGILLIALTWFVTKTIWGKAMRAISMDRPTCRLMGINVNTIIGITFFIGSALAAVAGVMACVYYGNVHYFMGYIMGMKAFTAAVIGGIGSIPGAMLGGLLLGLLEAAGTQVLGSSWKDVFAFGILIIMLIFKPTGLLGKTEVERM
ncbi:MAG TPA: branched-chain amino acid ABC transporter permease [Bacillota bacterium]|nr:branched-chain amino acid ABC transporter permease [Bacillota bacterium]